MFRAPATLWIDQALAAWNAEGEQRVGMLSRCNSSSATNCDHPGPEPNKVTLW
jgi:hypothetical protein